MADDRLELRCDYCGETRPIAVLHGASYRAFLDVEILQAFIRQHIGCRPEPPVLRFGVPGFTVVTEMGDET